MAQCNDASLSWKRAYRLPEPPPAALDAPSAVPPAVRHDDDLSRYIDGILAGERPPPATSYANGWPDDFRGWVIFAAMMTLAIWGMAKVWLL